MRGPITTPEETEQVWDELRHEAKTDPEGYRHRTDDLIAELKEREAEDMRIIQEFAASAATVRSEPYEGPPWSRRLIYLLIGLLAIAIAVLAVFPYPANLIGFFLFQPGVLTVIVIIAVQFFRRGDDQHRQ